MPTYRIRTKPRKPPYMVALARKMRKEPTTVERILWERLRSRRLDGHKFRRQVPFGRLVFDFYCSRSRLAVELDGSVHGTQREYDEYRDEYCRAAKITTLRFRNEEVFEDIQRVLDRIRAELGSGSKP